MEPRSLTLGQYASAQLQHWTTVAFQIRTHALCAGTRAIEFKKLRSAENLVFKFSLHLALLLLGVIYVVSHLIWTYYNMYTCLVINIGSASYMNILGSNYIMNLSYLAFVVHVLLYIVFLLYSAGKETNRGEYILCQLLE